MVTLETWGSKEEAIAATINSPLRCKKSYPQPRAAYTRYRFILGTRELDRATGKEWRTTADIRSHLL